MASPRHGSKSSTTTSGFDFGFDDEPNISNPATGTERSSLPPSRASLPPSRDEPIYTGGTGGTPRRRTSKFHSVSQSVRSTKTSNPRPYFRSRRIRKGTIDRPELREKDPRAIWITIIPLLGFAVGLAIIAVLSWSGYKSVVNHQYCLAFTDDFSNGFNTSIWTKDVETGGFG